MAPILTIGIILFSGFICGQIVARLGLPKVTGYILAGVLLNPDTTHLIPPIFLEHTEIVTNIALSFITFSVGGTLIFSRVRALGKPIVFITLLEAEFAFVFVAVSFLVLAPLIASGSGLSMITFFLPFSLLSAALASPTDPSVTLAIEHEYRAKGEVSSTIMSVAAFDDIIGIINYSISVSIASLCIANQPFGLFSIAQPLIKISGSIILGCGFGLLLNLLTKISKNGSDGVLITLIIGLLALCFGIAGVIGADELLSTMTMGIVVVNYNVKRDEIFQILERYTEEIIFVLFFTISAMHLRFSVLMSNYLLIIIFVVFRAFGKFSGTFVGGKLSKASTAVQKYTAGGLFPQGGIVIGLALVIKQNPALSSISDIIINIIIGTTIIHEVLGPLISKYTLQKAGEIVLHKKRR